MNDWDSYRFILALERSGTVRGAAEILGVNHSTVSRKLAWLNQKYAAPLFEKRPKGYQITEYGQPWLNAAHEMESIALSAERKQRAQGISSLKGEVSISVSIPIAQFLLNDVLPHFAEQYPNIELCIDATELNVDLDKSEADVVIRTTETPSEHLVGRRLFPYSVCYYGHKDYLARTRVEDYNWIGNKGDSMFPDWVKNSIYPHAPVTVRTTGYHMRYLALISQMGIARAACFMADSNPDLVRLENATPFSGLSFWVLTHPDLRDSPKVKAVMQFLMSTLTDKKPLIVGGQPIKQG